MTRYIAAALLIIAGCINTIRFPPDLNVWTWESADTGWWGEDRTTDPTRPNNNDPAFVRIERVFGGCDQVDEPGLSYQIITNAWTGGAVLDILRSTDSRRESHELRLIDLDPAGTWEWLAVGPLATNTPEGEFQPEVNTVFDCEADDGLLAFAIRLRNPSGETEHCVTWGDGPGVPIVGLDTLLRAEDERLVALGGCQVIEI